jgi:heat-inducible transcriptional repressor
LFEFGISRLGGAPLKAVVSCWDLKTMRQIDPKLLEERKKKILQAVIHHYIKSAKPVASSILSEGYNFSLSPATIRNLMSELEDEGYLAHPHTSAGRIPTDKGYREYVNSLIELQRLAIQEEARVKQEYNSKIKEIEDLLVQTSHVLSGLSNYSGFVLTPKSDKNKLQNIELINIADKNVLVIMVTESGMVKHKVLDVAIPRERLAVLSAELNERLKGLSLAEAKQKIYGEIEDIERREKDMFSFMKKMSREMFNFDEEVYMNGAENVMTLPEFHDYEPMRCLLKLTGDKDIIKNLFEKDLKQGPGVRVLIGSETSCAELKNLSIVSSVYRNNDNSMGVLGIIGPKRMEYQKMMALVNAVSKMLNKLISEM